MHLNLALFPRFSACSFTLFNSLAAAAWLAVSTNIWGLIAFTVQCTLGALYAWYILPEGPALLRCTPAMLQVAYAKAPENFQAAVILEVRQYADVGILLFVFVSEQARQEVIWLSAAKISDKEYSFLCFSLLQGGR